MTATKDVIYIDVEDDITSIIGKVKASNEKVVALVPPKRVGVLQSAVNLRLLERSAKKSQKRLVLITNNQALASLAAAAKLPVAKNLQSKPELGEIAVLKVDDENDVIDGSELPIGELARTADEPAGFGDEISLSGVNVDENGFDSTKKAVAPRHGETPGAPKSKKGLMVPNFNRFRKKFVLIGIGIVFLIGFLVWAIFFSSRATVEITAKTSSLPISQVVNLAAEESNDPGSLQAVKKEIIKKEAVEFVATGEENQGEKATGVVKLSKLSQDSIGVPAGTELTSSSGLTFTTNAAATIPASSPCFPSFCAGSVNVGVTAAGPGANFNAATGSLSGAPEGANGTFTGPTSGGTDKIVKVVTDSDVQKANELLNKKENPAVRSELEKSFGKGVKLIDTSYKVAKSDPTSTPKVGEVAAGNAKLEITMTYSMYAVSESELSTFLDGVLDKDIKDKENQRAYNNGIKKANFTNFEISDKKISAVVTANAQVGPQIKEEDLKKQIKGMRYGEVQEKLEAIAGINKVHTKFWPFWVSSVPEDGSRITIEFKLDESK